MQLQPIVLQERKAANIDKEIFTLIHGLRTFSTNHESISYRLINSYRLTSKSVKQTGLFYDNSLRSLSDASGLFFNGNYASLFCSDGGYFIGL